MNIATNTVCAIALFLVFPIHGYSLCLEGRHPSVSAETMESTAVVVGEVVSKTDLSDDPEDPEGITAIVYQVRVEQTLRGHIAGTISVRSENTSGRFPMEVSQHYVLFLQREEKDYFVDNCGNSGLLEESQTVIEELNSEPQKR